MKTRIENIKTLQDHPWSGRLFSKLSLTELHIFMKFVTENQHLNRNDFEMKVNRLYLDKEKTKNYSVVMELLSNLNSMSDGGVQ